MAKSAKVPAGFDQLKTLKVVVHFDDYIADPYWPERNTVIDIQKKSGMSRARSDDKRAQALSSYLKKEGITMEEYQRLCETADRKWYRLNPDDQTTEIVIPRHQFSSALVQAVASAPAGSRFPADDLRSKLRLGTFRTGKFKHDCTFERYIKPKESGQRRFQSNEVIKDFDATGTLQTIYDEDAVKHLMDHACFFVGIGAARKMGYGRGRVLSCEAVSDDYAEEPAK